MTNTYYIPVESVGCGCFVVLGIIIWVLIKIDTQPLVIVNSLPAIASTIIED